MAIEQTRIVNRGQVWFLIDNNLPAVHYEGSVQGKNRPWLVVSNNRCNQSSPIYTVVPLTTAAKTTLPTHVTFDANGKEQTILCEQIRTIPKNVFYNSGSNYKYVLSDDVMKQVDEALAVQLGISLTFPNSNNFWESLERLIRVKVKQSIEDSKVESIDVKRVVSNIDNIVDEMLKEEKPKCNAEPEPDPKPDVKLHVQPTITQAQPVKNKRRKWTTEDMKVFLEDCEKYPIKDVSTKYGMKIATIYATKYNFKKVLGGVNG